MPVSKRPPSAARKTFGARLREERRRQGLTLEDVAEAADMNWSYIAQVERGTRNVSIDNMAALADAVGLPLMELLNPVRSQQDDPQALPEEEGQEER